VAPGRDAVDGFLEKGFENRIFFRFHEDFEPIFAFDLIQAPAGQFLHVGVKSENTPFCVQHENNGLGGLNQAFGKFMLGTHLFFGIFTQCDVQVGAKHPLRLAVPGPGEELAPVEHPYPGTVLVPHAAFAVVIFRAAVETLLEQPFGFCHVVGMAEFHPRVDGDR